MKKGIFWRIVFTGIMLFISILIYQQIATNNKPDSLQSFVKDIHDKVTPKAHQRAAE